MCQMFIEKIKWYNKGIGGFLFTRIKTKYNYKLDSVSWKFELYLQLNPFKGTVEYGRALCFHVFLC